MARILLVAIVLLALAGTATAQVPYTSSPYPSWQPAQPTQPSYDPFQELMRQNRELMQPRPLAPTPRKGSTQRWRTSQQPAFQWPYPQETAYDKMMREFRQEQDRTAEQRQREFQAEQQERATRCNRFGSREVFGDCHNW